MLVVTGQARTMVSTDRAVAYVHLGILGENYRTIRSKLSPGVGLLCVVKADAYGHGAIEVSRRLEALGVSSLGVATVEEGVELRINNIKAPILVLSGIMPWDDISTFLEHDLTPAIYNLETLTRIRARAGTFCAPLKVHMKFDTGMGRLGFSAKDAAAVMDCVENVASIQIDGLMTHFSGSETRDQYGIDQVTAFKEVVRGFVERGFRPRTIHMANSGAIINYPEAHFTMVRTGISLYGSHPSKDLKEKLPTRQVMKFASKVALTREFPVGYALSYGRSFVTERRTVVAYIPVGYADGYPRALSNKGYVLIKDRPCPVVGRVCMDWLLVDVTDLSTVSVNDEVILLGEGKSNTITADEIGEIADTIPYEILTQISRRVPRVYIG